MSERISEDQDPRAVPPEDTSPPKATSRLRVLWLIKGLGVGGIERLLTWTAAERNREDFECEVAYLLPWASDLRGQLESVDVPVHCLEARNEFDLTWPVRLRRLLIARPFDVCHFHSPYVAGIARLVVQSLPRRVRPRLVSTEYNVWRDYPLPTRVLNALTYRMDDAHLALSEAVRLSIVRPLRGSVEAVIHGIPLDYARRHLDSRERIRAELGIEEHDVVVGTVANLRAQKGYPDLLAAARRVLDDNLPVRFLAIGQGPLEVELRERHRALGLGERFRFLGHREDAIHVLSACDLFALASLYEGGPVAVFEALAMGLPVVATRVGVVPDVITDGVEGRVVPPGRPDLLAHAITELVRDPERLAGMARAAYERGSQFDITTAVRRIESIYREVVTT